MELRAQVLLWKLVLLQSEFGCGGGGGGGGREPPEGLSPSPGLRGCLSWEGVGLGASEGAAHHEKSPRTSGPTELPLTGRWRRAGQGGRPRRGLLLGSLAPPNLSGMPLRPVLLCCQEGSGWGTEGGSQGLLPGPGAHPPPPHPCRAGLLTRHIPPSGWAPGHISGAGIWRVGWQMVGSLPTSSLLVLQTSALREGRGGSWVGRQPSEDPGGRACEAWTPGRCHSGCARTEAPQTSQRCQALVLLWPCCSDG